MDRKQTNQRTEIDAGAASPEGPQSPASQQEDLPPVYTTNGALQTSDTNIPGTVGNVQFPSLDYASYRPPSSTVSSDLTKITTSHRLFCKSAAALTDFIRQQAAIPPRPIIRIKGVSENSTRSFDFDLKLNLLPYIYRAQEPWNYLSLKSDDDTAASSSRKPAFKRSQSSNRSLEAWAKEFCSDSASIKTFTLERQVANFDIDRLSGLVRNTFAELQYGGRLEVRLETSFAKIVVDNQSTKGAGAFFRPLVSAFVGSKDYDAVKAVWPFARSAHDDSHASTSPREFASVSELAWWKEWKIAVVRAAFEKRSGWVSIEDKLEVVMMGWLQDATNRPTW